MKLGVTRPMLPIWEANPECAIVFDEPLTIEIKRGDDVILRFVVSPTLLGGELHAIGVN